MSYRDDMRDSNLTDQETVYVDKRYRARLFAICVVIVLFGLAVTQWGVPALTAYLEGQEPETAKRIVQAGLVLLFLGLVPFALHLMTIGRRTILSERFPPPGTKVVKDTKLIVGPIARTKGWTLIAFSVILVLLSIGGAVLAWYFVELVMKGVEG